MGWRSLVGFFVGVRRVRPVPSVLFYFFESFGNFFVLVVASLFGIATAAFLLDVLQFCGKGYDTLLAEGSEATARTN